MPRVHLAVCQASLSSGCHDLAQVSDWSRHTRRPATIPMHSTCLALTGPSHSGHKGLACCYLRTVRLPPLQAAGSSTNKKARETKNLVVQAARLRVSLGSCTRRRHALAELDELNHLGSFCQIVQRHTRLPCVIFPRISSSSVQERRLRGSSFKRTQPDSPHLGSLLHIRFELGCGSLCGW